MPEPTERGTRAERWAQNLGPQSDAVRIERMLVDRDRKNEAHWERLHQQLYWLPLYFTLWSLAVGVVVFVLAMLFGVAFTS